MEVKVTNGNDDNRPKLEVEEIKKRILADDTLTTIAELPLYYNMTSDIDYNKITYLFFTAMIDDLKTKPAEKVKLKKKLEAGISEYYLHTLVKTYAIMEKVTAIALLTSVASCLYEINLIKDKDVKTFKTKQVKAYIKYLDLQKIIDDILFTIGNKGFLMNLDAEAFTKDLQTNFNNIAFMVQLTRKFIDFTNYLMQNDDTSTAKYIALDKQELVDVLLINKYTEYNLLTKDGKDNYIKRHDSVDKKMQDLEKRVNEARILEKDGVKIRENADIITYNEFIDIVAFDDEEREILTREEKDELAGLESVGTPIKPNSMTYITNKVQRNLDKVESLTDIDTDLLPISLSKHKGDIVINASMETMQDAIHKLNLSKYDILVHTACKSLLKENKEINTESIFDYLTGNAGERPNKTALDDIEKSLDTLKSKTIRLSYGTDKQLKSRINKKDTIRLDFESPLLPLKKLKVKYKGKEHTFYKLIGTYEENDYFKFIDNLGQLASIPTLYLNNGGNVRNTSENILITNYLVEQITLIRSGSLDTNKISYDKIYALCGIDSNTDEKDSPALIQRKNRIRANVANILKERRKQGLITNYNEYKETQGTAHRVAGVEIFTEATQKKK